MLSSSKRARRLMAGVAVLALALAACGGDDPGTDPPPPPSTEPGDEPTETDEFAELVAAAQAEGRVVWYQAGSPHSDRVPAAFEEKYGITVDFIALPQNELNTRFDNEIAAGVQLPDVMSSSIAADFNRWSDVIIRMDEAGVPAMADYPRERISEAGAAMHYITTWCIGYNTNLVSADEVPDWDGLLDPEWEGQIILVDPGASEAQIQFYDRLRQDKGDDYLVQLGEQAGVKASSVTPSVESLAAGEGALAVLSVFAVTEGAKNNGAPVDCKTTDFTVGIEVYIAITADAENPNAARLFAHFLLEEETNREFVTNRPGEFSPWGGGDFPPEYFSPDPNARDNTALIVELLGF